MERENLLRSLREDLKKHRDILKESEDDELKALGSALDSILLVTYDPNSLLILIYMLQDFMNDMTGGLN